MSAATDKGVLAQLESLAQIRADAILAAEVHGRGSEVLARRTALLDEAIEAHAAVAELIAADKEYDAAHEVGCYLRMKAAEDRRTAALARVQP